MGYISRKGTFGRKTPFKISGVYKIETAAGEYIGYSVDVLRRLDKHKCTTPQKDSCIAGVYKVLGFRLLEQTVDKTRESFYIKKYNPLLNKNSGFGKQ